MMTRRMRRLTRRSRTLAFAWAVLRSYREGRRRGQSPRAIEALWDLVGVATL